MCAKRTRIRLPRTRASRCRGESTGSPPRRARRGGESQSTGSGGGPLEASFQGVWGGESYLACVATPSFVPYVMPKLFSKSTLICRNCASGAHPSVAVEEGTEAPRRWPVRGVEGSELVQIHVRQT